MKDYIKHFGTEGMKWGVRKYQYLDGRFTPEGKERYFGNKEKYDYFKDTTYKQDLKRKAADIIGTSIGAAIGIGVNPVISPFTSVLGLVMADKVYGGDKLDKIKVKEYYKKGEPIADDFIKKYGDLTVRQLEAKLEDDIRKESFEKNIIDDEDVFLAEEVEPGYSKLPKNELQQLYKIARVFNKTDPGRNRLDDFEYDYLPKEEVKGISKKIYDKYKKSMYNNIIRG